MRSLIIPPIRMSDADGDSDVVSEVSEVPDTPKRPKGRPKNAPKGNSVEAGKGKSGKATSRTTFTADEGNSLGHFKGQSVVGTVWYPPASLVICTVQYQCF